MDNSSSINEHDLVDIKTKIYHYHDVKFKLKYAMVIVGIVIFIILITYIFYNDITVIIYYIYAVIGVILATSIIHNIYMWYMCRKYIDEFIDKGYYKRDIVNNMKNSICVKLNDRVNDKYPDITQIGCRYNSDD